MLDAYVLYTQKFVIFYLAKAGYAVDRKDVCDIVLSYTKNDGRTVPWKKKPGKEWSMAFERRWVNQLSRRKSEQLTKAQAQGLSEEVVDLFFEQYRTILNENGLEDSPERIFNLDETGLNTDPRFLWKDASGMHT